MSVFNIIDEELTVSSVFIYDNVYGAAVSLNNNGSVPIKKMIVHHFNLKNASKALDLAHVHSGNVIKRCICFLVYLNFSMEGP